MPSAGRSIIPPSRFPSLLPSVDCSASGPAAAERVLAYRRPLSPIWSPASTTAPFLPRRLTRHALPVARPYAVSTVYLVSAYILGTYPLQGRRHCGQDLNDVGMVKLRINVFGRFTARQPNVKWRFSSPITWKLGMARYLRHLLLANYPTVLGARQKKWKWKSRVAGHAQLRWT